MVLGIFANSKSAGDAVAELKQKGYTNDISVVTRDEEANVVQEEVKADSTDEAATGMAAGATVGGLAGIIAGLTSVVVPGVGPLLVAGPLLAAWGITGAAVGALAGGVVGALAGIGLPQDVAMRYEGRIKSGDVLVAVSTEPDREADAEAILTRYNAEEVTRVAHR